MAVQGCGDEGKEACHASDLENAINAQKLASLLYDPTGQKQEQNTKIAEAIIDGGEFVVSIFFDPADWVITAADCASGECSFWTVMFAALPIVPAKAGKFVGELFGQFHHILSTKIMRELATHSTLNGVFTRNDFVVQAMDRASHKGYQGWHRVYDDEVVDWLSINEKATPEEFLNYLRDVYLKAEMESRFPDAFLLLQMALEEIQ